jgi:hypothetical protein
MNAGNPVQIDLFGVAATGTKDTEPPRSVLGYHGGSIAMRVA